MKSIIKSMFTVSAVVAGALATMPASADGIFSYKTSADGYSYIEINHDVASFSFEVAGYGSSVYDGRVSYFLFEGDDSPAATAFKTKTSIFGGKTTTPTAVDGAVKLERGDRAPVTFENLKAGDKIGFSLYDTDGKYVNQFDWNFEGIGSKSADATAFFSPYAADVSNVGYHNDVYAFLHYGFHYDDLVSIKSFYVNGNSLEDIGNDWETYEETFGGGDGGGKTNGAPLPGALAMFLLGGCGLGVLKFKERRA